VDVERERLGHAEDHPHRTGLLEREVGLDDRHRRSRAGAARPLTDVVPVDQVVRVVGRIRELQPRDVVAELVSTTVISRTACSPAGMSIPFTGSSSTSWVAVPVLTGVHVPEPEIFVTLTELEVGGRGREIVEDAHVVERRVCGVDGTVIR
jgi:hypothetical protein